MTSKGQVTSCCESAFRVLYIMFLYLAGPVVMASSVYYNIKYVVENNEFLKDADHKTVYILALCMFPGLILFGFTCQFFFDLIQSCLSSRNSTSICGLLVNIFKRLLGGLIFTVLIWTGLLPWFGDILFCFDADVSVDIGNFVEFRRKLTCLPSYATAQFVFLNLRILIQVIPLLYIQIKMNNLIGPWNQLNTLVVVFEGLLILETLLNWAEIAIFWSEKLIIKPHFFERRQYKYLLENEYVTYHIKSCCRHQVIAVKERNFVADD